MFIYNVMIVNGVNAIFVGISYKEKLEFFDLYQLIYELIE